MRQLFCVLCFLAVAILTCGASISADATVAVSPLVGNQLCGASAGLSGPGAFDIACNVHTDYGSASSEVNAHLGYLSGGVIATADSSGGDQNFLIATNSFSFNLNQDYVLTGGHGQGEVFLTFFNDGDVPVDCSFSFAGVNSNCGAGLTDFTFMLNYGQVYPLILTAYASESTAASGAVEEISYDFSTLPGTDFAPVPEPSSLVLLGTGLLGAVGAARRKFLS